MRPVLWLALAASVAATAWLASQPEADAADQATEADEAAQGAAQGAAVLPLAPRRLGAGPASGAGANAAPVGGAAPVAAGLPARAADWPAPEPSALQAWGAAPAPAPSPSPSPAAVAAARRSAGDSPAPLRAPAFAYQWIGTLDDERGQQVLLGGPLRSAAVRPGQVLDGQWRIDAVRHGRLDLTWLPGNQGVSVRAESTARRGANPSDHHDDNPGPDS
ncbi:hypothetical protein [Aquabacterium sp. OR-4]|uniref:hypothetical protein n=1 Tax=Aquabacterium sp. OR-4 TaxID=2978127 RepID=UPI0028C95474|nr:hypothetical protein [Aquabacterium sp. OR-4]MDT7838948.1 hypothetical protein [Aquabacterium sp. OR-4]